MKTAAHLLALTLWFLSQNPSATDTPAPTIATPKKTGTCLAKNLGANCSVLAQGVFTVDNDQRCETPLPKFNTIITQARLINKDTFSCLIVTDDFAPQHENAFFDLLPSLPDEQPLLDKLTVTTIPASSTIVANFTLTLAYRTNGNVIYYPTSNQTLYRQKTCWTTGYVTVFLPLDHTSSPAKPHTTPNAKFHFLNSAMRTIEDLNQALDCSSIWVNFPHFDMTGVAWPKNNGPEHLIPVLSLPIHHQPGQPDPFCPSPQELSRP